MKTDIDSIKKLEIILDNLINRNPEPEDTILVASGLLKQLLEEVKALSKSKDRHWRDELKAL